MIFKKIGSICFALAFLAAIAVFTDYGNSFISKSDAKLAIILLGSIALLMNLLSFKYDQHTDNNNIVFWIGTVIVFVGLVLKMRQVVFNEYLLIIGLITIGFSYFYNPFQNSSEKDDDLLDQ